MIPVPDAQIAPYSAKGGRHRSMFFRQLDFCANNERLIRSRALEIAKRRASCPNSFEQAAFCDFGALFKAMEAYCPAKGPEGAK
jgi:hypothetical protein